jgi:hypothetical protein
VPISQVGRVVPPHLRGDRRFHAILDRVHMGDQFSLMSRFRVPSSYGRYRGKAGKRRFIDMGGNRDVPIGSAKSRRLDKQPWTMLTHQKLGSEWSRKKPPPKQSRRFQSRRRSRRSRRRRSWRRRGSRSRSRTRSRRRRRSRRSRGRRSRRRKR